MIFIPRKGNTKTNKEAFNSNPVKIFSGKNFKGSFNNSAFCKAIFSFPPVSEGKVLSAKAKGVTEALWEKGCECTLKSKQD